MLALTPVPAPARGSGVPRQQRGEEENWET
jgi:hypothetical protein